MPRYRKPVVQGVTGMAIEVVIETGDAGPVTPIGVNLPNDQKIREEYGSKSVSLTNVLDAYERSTLHTYREEFAWDEAEVERATRWGAFAGELTTDIHEVLGHGSGRMADDVIEQPQDLLKEQYSALEESRADLVALYFVADPYLAALGILSAEDQDTIVRAEYEAYARNALVQLRRVRIGTQLEEDHMRNRQAIVNWLLAHTGVDRGSPARRQDLLRGRGRRGVPRRAWRGCSTEVQRIKSEGDYAAAKALFETYGVHFDADLRDEIVRRVDHAGPAVVYGIRDAEARTDSRCERRHHRHRHLVSLRPDHADAGVFATQKKRMTQKERSGPQMTQMTEIKRNGYGCKGATQQLPPA